LLAWLNVFEGFADGVDCNASNHVTQDKGGGKEEKQQE